MLSYAISLKHVCLMCVEQYVRAFEKTLKKET